MMASPFAAPAVRLSAAASVLALFLMVPPALGQAQPRFDVLVIAEAGGEIHAPMVAAAKTWHAALAKDSGIAFTYVENPSTLTDAMLAKYELILQLNYTPWRWSLTAKAAFERYIEEGRGGWIGVHHALLFGSQFLPQGEPLWTWFFKFMGEITYRNYIASFAEATVRVEASDHPVFQGVPATFRVGKEEWYTWDKSPRPKTTVLANVDENSYTPNSNIKMGGDHPVVWTNTNAPYKARNLFLFMGHHPDHYKNEAYVALMRNAIFWAAAKPPTSARPVRYGRFVEGGRMGRDREGGHVLFRNPSGAGRLDITGRSHSPR